MDILMLIAIITMVVLTLLGKPIKIEMTHKHMPQEFPTIETLPIEEEKETEEPINAFDIMKKFNEEWSGIKNE